ncbi:ribonuclease Z [Clostridium autoethanogenum]|uniref:Ribonuclease Z n=1 Tax=Clostridium autoethanogenum TaxID=84023 RepID=A0A3M0SXD1_9CLOT|nr:ribonuclease Z [Clostridium autoethanogenum]RMD03030.1 ribonuclease Z [Clostridium autoethanogenum]
MLDLCLLGCGGSMPVPDRYLTSMIASYNGKKLLIDCGEGTQVSLKILGCKIKNIDVILFTHFHADHIAGLPGLLLTIANSGRNMPITIIGPIGLRKVIEGLMVIAPVLPYSINLLELCGKESYFEKIGDFNIDVLPVDHGMPCFAYSIGVDRNRKFDRDKALKNQVPLILWNRLQKREKLEYGEKLYTPEMVIGDKRSGLKVSYCTHSRPTHELVQFVEKSDVFICEGMYGKDENISKAIQYKHMLFSEAAALAKRAEVGELWLTHFSPSMPKPELYLQNAQSIFEKTVLGKDRYVKSINFKD